MIGRPHSADVAAEFLREVLAHGAITVSELEAKARTAGLLADHQSITHAKAFKKTKKALGIRSVRNGFGDQGEWSWSLMNQPAMPATEPSGRPLSGLVPVGDTYGDAQQASSLEDESAVRRVPFVWIEWLTGLDPLRPPTDVPPHRWRQFLADCNKFLNASEGWAERAATLGWNALALFGCRRKVPLLYLGDAGLLWAINGGRLVELHRDWAVIEPAANTSQRIFHRRHNTDPRKVALPSTYARNTVGPENDNPGDRNILEINPMHQGLETRLAQLASAPRCGARTRSGTQCRSPAVRGRARCQMHGGKSPGAPKGVLNGNFKTGDWSQEIRAERRWLHDLVRSCMERTKK